MILKSYEDVQFTCPRNSTEIKVIESFADKIKHQDIPTAFDLDHALNQLEEELRLSEEEKQKVNSYSLTR